jgi:hypothetical protein
MAQEKRVAHIHGINERGQLFSIAVYRKDGATRLSYLAESHYVLPNEDTIAGWRDVAARTWRMRIDRRSGHPRPRQRVALPPAHRA